MASCKTDFLYSLSSFTNWWQIPHHPKMNQIPHKKTLQGYCFPSASINPNTRVAIHCETHFLKGQHVWKRLDWSQRTYVGFSQWAATCNTKSFNIHASANIFFFSVTWIFFMVIKSILFCVLQFMRNFICIFNFRIFFRNCKKHNWQNLRSVKFRTNKVYTCI